MEDGLVPYIPHARQLIVAAHVRKSVSCPGMMSSTSHRIRESEGDLRIEWRGQPVSDEIELGIELGMWMAPPS